MKESSRINPVFLLTVIAYLATSIVVSLFQEKFSFSAIILISQVGLLAVPLGYALIRGNLKKETGLKPIRPGVAALVILLILCLEPLLTFLNALSQCFVSTPTTSAIIEEAAKRPFTVMFLLVAVLPAICEEFVYRGVFFRAYAKDAVYPGAILSGLLFGVMHGNWNQFGYAFVMGFFFALTVFAADSLFASMLMHLTVNGISVIILYAFPKLAEVTGDTAGETAFTVPLVMRTYLVPALFGLVLAFLLLKAIAQRCGTWEKLKQEIDRKGKLRTLLKMISFPLGIGILLMMLLMTASEIVG